MIEIPFLISLFLSLFAGLYDLKTSDVHEEIPTLMISFGLFYWFINSLIFKNPILFYNSLIFGFFFLLFGLILFKLKMWGDGDAWILGGIGFLAPFQNFFHCIIFLVFLFIIGTFYSLIYILIYGLRSKKIKKKFILEFNKYKSFYLGFLLISIAVSFYYPFFLLIGILPILYIYSKIIEKNMKKKVKVSELKEGDVLADGKIVGLTREEIEKLKKEKKWVEIQDGVRFTIVFPITLIFIYLLLQLC